MKNEWHGVVFHYFCGGIHPYSQGSISSDEFSFIIEYLISKYSILDAVSFVEKVKAGKLKKDEKCIIFFSGAQSQIDIALPILNSFNVTGFWFPYACIYNNEPEPIEIFHHFRSKCFSSPDEFYNTFFKETKKYLTELSYHEGEDAFLRSNYFCWGNYYTEMDRKYKYFRDILLGNTLHYEIMCSLMNKCGYNYMNYLNELWISASKLKELSEQGHVIGHHGLRYYNYSIKKEDERAIRDYIQASDIINSITGHQYKVISYPGNAYDVFEKALSPSDSRFDCGFVSSMNIDRFPFFLSTIDVTTFIKHITNGNLNLDKVSHNNTFC